MRKRNKAHIYTEEIGGCIGKEDKWKKIGEGGYMIKFPVTK